MDAKDHFVGVRKDGGRRRMKRGRISPGSQPASHSCPPRSFHVDVTIPNENSSRWRDAERREGAVETFGVGLADSYRLEPDDGGEERRQPRLTKTPTQWFQPA